MNCPNCGISIAGWSTAHQARRQARTVKAAGERFKRWEPRDILYLKRNYKTVAIDKMALELHRTYKGVKAYLTKHRRMFPR